MLEKGGTGGTSEIEKPPSSAELGGLTAGGSNLKGGGAFGTPKPR